MVNNKAADVEKPFESSSSLRMADCGPMDFRAIVVHYKNLKSQNLCINYSYFNIFTGCETSCWFSTTKSHSWLRNRQSLLKNRISWLKIRTLWLKNRHWWPKNHFLFVSFVDRLSASDSHHILTSYFICQVDLKWFIKE